MANARSLSARPASGLGGPSQPDRRWCHHDPPTAGRSARRKPNLGRWTVDPIPSTTPGFPFLPRASCFPGLGSRRAGASPSCHPQPTSPLHHPCRPLFPCCLLGRFRPAVRPLRRTACAQTRWLARATKSKRRRGIRARAFLTVLALAQYRDGPWHTHPYWDAVPMGASSVHHPHLNVDTLSDTPARAEWADGDPQLSPRGRPTRPSALSGSRPRMSPST